MKGSELIISDDGTLYHLGLKSDDKIPKNIILVGDPARVYQVAEHFDKGITFEQKNREFITVCGTFRNVPVAAIGVGIGTDNTEIAAVELYALHEYNHKTNSWKPRDKNYRPLNIVRVGTSGCPQKYIAIGSLAISEYAIGLDNTGIYYPYQSRSKTLRRIKETLSATEISRVYPYVSQATPQVVRALAQGCREIELKKNHKKGFYIGITSSASGFYAPQGRRIGRLKEILIPNLQKNLAEINVHGRQVINNEMESSAMFRILGERLKYRVGTICAILANRNDNEFVDPNEYQSSVNRAIMAGLRAIKILPHT